jgi:hypothetical protein
VKLEIERVPTPLWGESLYRLLTRTEWDKIRKPALDRAAGHCEICGAVSSPLLCHEQWSYDDENAKRTLTGIQAVCGLCSSVIHIGRAGAVAAQGLLDMQDVYDHFMRVNDIDWPTAQRAVDDGAEIHKMRNQRIWTTDFGPYQPQVDARRAKFPAGRIPVAFTVGTTRVKTRK